MNCFQRFTQYQWSLAQCAESHRQTITLLVLTKKCHLVECIGLSWANKLINPSFFYSTSAIVFWEDFSWQTLVQPRHETTNGHSPSWCCITSLPLWWSCFQAVSLGRFTSLLWSLEQQHRYTRKIPLLNKSMGFSPITKKQKKLLCFLPTRGASSCIYHYIPNQLSMPLVGGF